MMQLAQDTPPCAHASRRHSRGAAAAIIVYDITSTDSFNRAKAWVRELQRQGGPNMIMALAGEGLAARPVGCGAAGSRLSPGALRRAAPASAWGAVTPQQGSAGRQISGRFSSSQAALQ
jgi:hypothetical protein